MGGQSINKFSNRETMKDNEIVQNILVCQIETLYQIVLIIITEQFGKRLRVPRENFGVVASPLLLQKYFELKIKLLDSIKFVNSFAWMFIFNRFMQWAGAVGQTRLVVPGSNLIRTYTLANSFFLFVCLFV